jgi:beta-phosphoglucomutase-like phosphatase (HAD superfamily)
VSDNSGAQSRHSSPTTRSRVTSARSSSATTTTRADEARPLPGPRRVGILEADNVECASVGDSDTDVFAGLLAGVAVIGYANKPCKAKALADVQPARG